MTIREKLKSRNPAYYSEMRLLKINTADAGQQAMPPSAQDQFSNNS
jgi:hypothetical protein